MLGVRTSHMQISTLICYKTLSRAGNISTVVDEEGVA